MQNIFLKFVRRRRDGRIEFDEFRRSVEAVLREAGATTAGFSELKHYYSGLHVALDHPDVVSAGFGLRPSNVIQNGERVFEKGARIEYALMPTGDVAITLFPCRSNVAAAPEDLIIIAIGYFSAFSLRKRVKMDMRALVAYSYESCIETETTLSQRLRVFWLRKTKPRQVEGTYVAGGSSLLMGTTLESAYRAAVLAAWTAIMRPLGLLLVAYVLVAYGLDAWSVYLSK